MGISVDVRGRVDYLTTLDAMQTYTAARGPEAADLLWICEHEKLFTQGLAGKSEHVLAAGDIPVIFTNRGGQITHHGPGQVVAYPLVDLRRAGYYVKEYVYRLEQAVVHTLAEFGVTGLRVAGAPGIYVRPNDPGGHARWDPSSRLPFDGLAKIAALGIKVSRHCAYHGLALNVAMDLEPFGRINPCGYAGLQTTDLSTIGVVASWKEVACVLSQKLVDGLTP